MQLNVGGGAGVTVAGFDDIGVEGALREKAGTFNIFGFAFKRLDELAADDFPFLLRVGDAFQFAQELFTGGARAEVNFEMIAEGGLDEVALVFSEQAVVYEDADELIADRLMQQG